MANNKDKELMKKHNVNTMIRSRRRQKGGEQRSNEEEEEKEIRITQVWINNEKTKEQKEEDEEDYEEQSI